MKQFFNKSLMLGICFTAVGVGSWAQTSAAPQPSPSPKKTIFGLPLAKPDKSTIDAPAPKGADAVEDRSLPSGFKEVSEGDLRTNWARAAKVFVVIEGTIQGKFKSTPQGEDLGFECLNYALHPQPGGGGKSTITISIAKESDGANSQLYRALETGEPLKTVTLNFLAKGGGREVHRATLTGASIINIRQNGDPKTRRILEDVSLNFTKIVMN